MARWKIAGVQTDITRSAGDESYEPIVSSRNREFGGEL